MSDAYLQPERESLLRIYGFPFERQPRYDSNPANLPLLGVEDWVAGVVLHLATREDGWVSYILAAAVRRSAELRAAHRLGGRAAVAALLRPGTAVPR